MSIQDDAVKSTVTEIVNQAMTTEQVLNGLLVGSNLTETIATAIDTRFLSTIDQKRLADSVKNSAEYLIPAEQLSEEVTIVLVRNPATLKKAFIKACTQGVYLMARYRP